VPACKAVDDVVASNIELAMLVPVLPPLLVEFSVFGASTTCFRGDGMMDCCCSAIAVKSDAAVRLAETSFMLCAATMTAS
jgi:hypothetical protein